MNARTISEERRTLGALLRLTYEALAVRVYGGLAARGFPDIRRAHSAVFRHIRPEGSRLTELAERAGMTKQSMAYLVQALSEAGYVAVTPDASDGRARLVRLTPRGRQVWEALVDLSAEAEAAMARRIGAERLAALRATLADIVGDGSAWNEPPVPEAAGARKDPPEAG